EVTLKEARKPSDADEAPRSTRPFAFEAWSAPCIAASSQQPRHPLEEEARESLLSNCLPATEACGGQPRRKTEADVIPAASLFPLERGTYPGHGRMQPYESCVLPFTSTG